MAEDDQAAAMQPAREPFYEPIGGGRINEPPEGGDDAGSPPRADSATRVALRQAIDDWLRSIRTVRFWGSAVMVLVGVWLAAAAFVAVMMAQEDSLPAENQLWTYMLASAFVTPAASLLAVRWGLRGIRPVQPQDGTGNQARSPLADFFATVARGLVFAVLALVLLLLQAAIAGAPESLAVAAAGVVVVESTVFGAIAAGASAWLGRPRSAGIAVWALACWLVLGNLAAAWALLPAVRAQEPVAVVLNIEWGSNGVPVSYDCAAELVRQTEVFHTERIMWLAAPNPMVIFIMVAVDTDTDAGLPGWLPVALQEAANGTQVPCVNAEPRTEGSFQTPLAVMGLAMQGGLAGGLLAAGHRAARRRVTPEGTDQGTDEKKA